MRTIATAVRGIRVQSLRDLSVYRDDNAAEIELAERETTEDLLDLVPDVPADLRTEGQINYMEDLITNLTAMNSDLGQQARRYTDGMTERGLWTPGREGNASAWITRLLAKLDELRVVERPNHDNAVGQTKNVEIPAGRYAITDEGEVKCYTIEYGREGTKWAGFLFLNRISSDDRYRVNRAAKARILAEISKDVTASAILAGLTLRQCRRCGRTLSDTKNPYFEVALGPECGTK